MKVSDEEIEGGVARLAKIINSCSRWKTVASCEGHPFEPKRGDQAFVTFKLVRKNIKDYGFFHSLLSNGINISFGHENRVVICHPWRQYGENPKRQEKQNLNQYFIKKAECVFSSYLEI